MEARVAPSKRKEDRHRKLLREMHDALYKLSNSLPSEFPDDGGSDLLPGTVVPEKPEAAAARTHIQKLHAMFRSMKGSK